VPRNSKGPRLWPEKRRGDFGGKNRQPCWVIRDGAIKRSTGVRVESRKKPPAEAEQKLADYIASKHAPSREGIRSAASVLIADVLSIYAEDKGPKQARPQELGMRMTALLGFWGNLTLAQVSGRSCRAYADSRSSPAAARRELEDLRAAITHHRKEGLCSEVVEVVLPAKSQARERWLTRSEAAQLIWSSWRYREVQKGRPTGRRSRQHVARFILVGLYTGTRAGAVCKAALAPTDGAGWIDLDAGVFYRRPQGQRETKKRQTPARVPDRLLAHLRRWQRLGICERYAVEWRGAPVAGVDKAFKHAVEHAGLKGRVTPHTLRHTAATWLMQNGTDLGEAASYLGLTVETLERIYWHHHPDFQVAAARNITAKPGDRSGDRYPVKERERTTSKATKNADFSREPT
jgi:integrase